MPIDSQGWIKRADAILDTGLAASNVRAPEAVQFATSMYAALYGPEATQTKAFLSAVDILMKKKDGSAFELNALAHGAIKNAKEELNAGLIVSIRAVVAGEVLAELLRLAKEVLADQDDGAKNVSAVLVAAAFEDLVRRMGDQLAGVTGRPKLEDVVTALKNAGAIKGGQVGTAISYLKFRNDSLHADWKNVDRSQVESCLAFLESLLLKHFS